MSGHCQMCNTSYSFLTTYLVQVLAERDSELLSMFQGELQGMDAESRDDTYSFRELCKLLA